MHSQNGDGHLLSNVSLFAGCVKSHFAVVNMQCKTITSSGEMILQIATLICKFLCLFYEKNKINK